MLGELTAFADELQQRVARLVPPAYFVGTVSENGAVVRAGFCVVTPAVKVHVGAVRPHVRVAARGARIIKYRAHTVVAVAAHQTEPVVVQCVVVPETTRKIRQHSTDD